MKAVRIHEFGGPEVLKIEEIERPIPANDELLIKIYASGVNPADCEVRSGGNDMLRSFIKLPVTPGWDASGIVEGVGSQVTGFKNGDAVYGVPNFPGDGSYAEYVVAKAGQFAVKPVSLSFNEAAGVPLAALTAWAGMFAHGQLKKGQHILIHGASGGVGSFAVQFAKAKGAYVSAIASADNLDYLKKLGADEVIDYKTQNFGNIVHEADLVLEASPNRDNKERLKSVKVLREGGRFVSVNLDYPFNDEIIEDFRKKSITGELAPNQPRQDWLQEIGQLIDEGKVKVFISKVYPLDEVQEAHRKSETWHVRGKLILEIRKEGKQI